MYLCTLYRAALNALCFVPLFLNTPTSHPQPPALSLSPEPIHTGISYSSRAREERMSTICAEQHKFHPSHQLHHYLKKPTIEIPPRKLLIMTNRKQDQMPTDPFEPSNIHKHLSHNGGNTHHTNNDGSSDYDSDTDDPYATDHFRMYEFKVRRCTRSRSHDWTECPFAHPGEKARRRDPRRYHYSGTVCSEFRRGGSCSRGDQCEFAHGVFECWLHPSRYRTEACKDGENCKRKVCFFAHSSRQLRVLPDALGSNYSSSLSSVMNHLKSNSNSRSRRCYCFFCLSMSESPTSTLLGLSHFSRSPSLSPPLSPVTEQGRNTVSGFSPVSRHSDRLRKFGSSGRLVGYKDVLNDLKSSLEAMNLNEALCSSPSTPSPLSLSGCRSKKNKSINFPWLEACFDRDQELHQQHEFVLSPSTPNPNGSRDFSGDGGRVGGDVDPDLGWVNELLM